MEKKKQVLPILSFATFVTGLFLVACSLNTPEHPHLKEVSAIAAVGAVSSGYFLLKS